MLCRMSTPTANMDPDQLNAETRAATVRLAVSEIMRVPLEVATGLTCAPQGVCPIQARFTFKFATSGHGGTLFSFKYCYDPEKHGDWAGHRAKMVAHSTGPMSSPWRHAPLMRYTHNKLRIQNTFDLCDFICMRFYILIFWLKSITRTPAHQCTITVLNTVYVYKYLVRIKQISVEDWGFSVQFWPWHPLGPFSVSPP